MAPKKTGNGADEPNSNSNAGAGTKRKAEAINTRGTGQLAASSSPINSGCKKKKMAGNQKTLQAALSGECDTLALLKSLHDDITNVRQQRTAETVLPTNGPMDPERGYQEHSGDECRDSPVRKREVSGPLVNAHLESFLVGHKVDLFNAAGEMKSGRILRYDARKDQHLLALQPTGVKRWVTLREESARVSLEVVWGRIYGAPWWPGEVWCHTTKFLGGEQPYPLVEGKVLVVFFAGNTHGWINPSQNVEGQMRLMVEEVEE